MISRYQREIMKTLWSEAHKFDAFLKVELASSEAWMTLGVVPKADFEALKKATYEIDDIYRIEALVKHDVIAFTKAVGLHLGDEKKWLHYGLTSTDVVDSAQALILKKVNQVLLEDIDLFMTTLKEMAMTYKDQPCIGRTHGMHAEVTSFGLKFALWYEDFKRLRKNFVDASDLMAVIKISGAVGNYSANTPELEAKVAQLLGIKAASISTQILQRDRHANYMSAIALLGSELEKIATEIRHLSRTEVSEVQEYFDVDQKGSSAMPHKRNPISSENISGLARLLRGYMSTAYENMALWHERDISHSSVERVILPDATSVLDDMLSRYQNTLKNLVINKKQMEKNITMTHGAVFAQGVLHALIDCGYDRSEAYDRIQQMALKSVETDQDLKTQLQNHPDFQKCFSKEKLDALFDPNSALKFVDIIYQNVFSTTK